MLLNQMILIIFHGETKTYKETKKKKKLFGGHPHIKRMGGVILTV